MDDQVIVVGGGLTGLTCAIMLARQGEKVRVLDAGATLGGRATTDDREGYLLNLGAHALYPSSARMLKRLGVKAAGARPRAEQGRVLWRGELLESPLAPAALLRPGPMSVRERGHMAAVLAGVGARRPSAVAALRGQSTQGWLQERTASPFVDDLMRGLMRVSTYCGDLAAQPAEIGVGLLREALLTPVRYVDGGWQSIVNALAAQARRAGVEIESGARVRTLLTDGAVAGVRLAGGAEHRGRAVVLAGLSPARAGRLLAEAGGRLPQEPRPLRAACLDVALRRLPRPDCPFVLGLDEPLYLSVHSAWSKLAPPEGAIVSLLRYDDGADPGADVARARLEALLDQAQPGWREQLLFGRFLPRVVVVHDLPAVETGLAGRPGTSDTGLAGAYLAGDWVGPEGWLAGAALHSALAAAAAVAAAGTEAGSVGAARAAA